MSVGRDLDFGDGHALKPLNFFVYPHVEVGGQLYKDVVTNFNYTALTVDGVDVPYTGEPTLEEVAHRLRKPQWYVSKCESGERRVDVGELQAFAGIYERPVSYFFPAEDRSS